MRQRPTAWNSVADPRAVVRALPSPLVGTSGAASGMSCLVSRATPSCGIGGRVAGAVGCPAPAHASDGLLSEPVASLPGLSDKVASDRPACQQAMRVCKPPILLVCRLAPGLRCGRAPYPVGRRGAPYQAPARLSRHIFSPAEERLAWNRLLPCRISGSGIREDALEPPATSLPPAHNAADSHNL